MLITLLTSTAVSLLFSAAANAATLNPKAPKPACRIELDNAHFSTTLLKHRREKFVKVNAWSVCNVRQLRVTLTLEIYKTEFFRDELVGKFKTKEFSQLASGLRVEINDAAVACKNNEPTHFYGVTYSKAIIGGKWQYAGKTRSPKTILFPCGT